MKQSSKAKIIYVGDPMCSWCYGIAPELEALQAEYEGKLEFEVVLGGLRPYNTEKMTDLKDFLTDHWKEVNHASGQEFSYGILDRSDLAYDTEPACRAVAIFRDHHVGETLDFFAKVQEAFYKKNQNPLLAATYTEILRENNWIIPNFESKFESKEWKEKVKDDFRKSQSLKVQSFPTVLLEKDGEYFPVARGYSTKKKMMNRIEDYLNL